jgi:hypothetical protein
MIGDGWSDVAVATVREVSKHRATNGNPPRLKLDITEVLYGEATIGPCDAILVPANYPTGPAGGCDEDTLGYWNRQPMKSASVGEKFIFVGKISRQGGKASLSASVWKRHTFTKQNHDWAIKATRRGEKLKQ